MIHHRDNFHIITGCSGAGKSSIIDELRARGFLCIDEIGRKIVKEQLGIGGNATPWQDQSAFRELLLRRYIDVFDGIAERNRPVFFDRGIPDLLGGPILEAYREAANSRRYARRVFLTGPWREIFRNDDERRHSYENALREYRAILETYPRYGYELIEIPKASIPERAAFILRELSPDPSAI